MTASIRPNVTVQAAYSTLTGLIVRENGVARPESLDYVEMMYSQAGLDAVMSSAPQWVDLEPFKVNVQPVEYTAEEERFRAFAHYDYWAAKYSEAYDRAAYGTVEDARECAHAKWEMDQAAKELAKYLKPVNAKPRIFNVPAKAVQS